MYLQNDVPETPIRAHTLCVLSKLHRLFPRVSPEQGSSEATGSTRLQTRVNKNIMFMLSIYPKLLLCSAVCHCIVIFTYRVYGAYEYGGTNIVTYFDVFKYIQGYNIQLSYTKYLIQLDSADPYPRSTISNPPQATDVIQIILITLHAFFSIRNTTIRNKGLEFPCFL